MPEAEQCRDPQAGPRPGGRQSTHLVLSRRALLVLAALIAAPWLLAALVLLRCAPRGPGRATAPSAAIGKPGPWGDLESVRITIAARSNSWKPGRR